MGILIQNKRLFCSKYHRERLKGTEYIDLNDTIQDSLCGAIGKQLLKYDEKKHEWFKIDTTKTTHELIFEAGIIYNQNNQNK